MSKRAVSPRGLTIRAGVAVLVGAASVGLGAGVAAALDPAPAPASSTAAQRTVVTPERDVVSAFAPYLALFGVLAIVGAALTPSKPRHRRQESSTATRRVPKPYRAAECAPAWDREARRRTRSPHRGLLITDEAPDGSTSMWSRTPGGSTLQHAERLDPDRHACATGARGELEVAAELATLPPGKWWTFHDVPVGTGERNIDHLVIGVGGVYSVNTRVQNGRVWVAERAVLVDGRRADFLPVAVHDARDAAERLSCATHAPVVVVPTLALVTAGLTVKAQPVDVAVLEVSGVADWIRSRPRTLTPHEAYEIVLAANRSETWA